MKRLIWLFVSLIWCASSAAGQTAPSRPAPAKQVGASKTAQPKFKAIWEPINYPDDLILMSVFFVNDQVGWIAGGKSWSQGGFILQTKDGGDHWTVQLGDPKSSDPSIQSLQFIDATHGWAAPRYSSKLLSTSDGQNWEESGTFPDGIHDYAFTSPTRGLTLTGSNMEGSTISLTKDGGKTWEKVFQCATKLEVNGLTQNTGCYLTALNFPTPGVGYAVGGSYLDTNPGSGFVVVVKTEDGGQSWNIVSTAPGVRHADAAFFTNASGGVTGNEGGRFYVTRDGGSSWKGATGSAQAQVHFTDPEVGWSSGGGRKVSYTTDGGMHWNSRDFSFPANIEAFSFPSRQRAYVVGQHGMIYRYRVVPVEYTSKGMLDAPMMPAANATQGSGN